MTDPRSEQPKPPFTGEHEQPHPGIQAQMRHKPDAGEESYTGTGKLKGKRAIITGGDSGIGRAVAIAFAREGADVGILYLNEHEDAREVQELVKKAGRKCVARAADFADGQETISAIENVAKELGSVDILVNNAAHQGEAVERFEDITDERMHRTFHVNIVAMFRTVRAVLPYMNKGGSIINVASIQAYNPSPAILDYATTKGAIVTFSKGLAQSLIERGIRVNCIAPGPVWTPLIVQSFDEKKIQQFGHDNPMGRPAQPVELAPAFVLLASPESAFINGEVLGVTGGKPLA